MPLFAGLKSFDIHMKAVDGVNQKTILGAVLTAITVIVVVYLLISEFQFYASTHVNERMITDSRASQDTVVIEYSITFPKLRCEGLNYAQEITRGSLHTDHEPDVITKIPIDGGKGCNIYGSTYTDKIGGNFRFHYDKNVVQNNEPINISHNINFLYFHAKNDNTQPRIPSNRGTLHPSNTVDDGLGIHQYVIQVVGIQYISADKKKSICYENDYSVTERHVYESEYEMIDNIGGHSSQDLLGVLVSYDFSPVMLVREEIQGNFWEFIANLIGMIGGVVTVFSLIEKILQSSSKVILGKKD